MARDTHVKEMEEAFGLLYQEFRRLKTVCVRQAELIKALTVRREITIDMAFTVPIQCTDTGKPDQSEGPFLRPQKKNGLEVAACNVPVAPPDVMVDRNHDQVLECCSKLDIMFPPTSAEYNFLISEPENLPHVNTVHLPEPPTPTDEIVQGSASNLYDDYRSTYSFNIDRSALEQSTVNIPGSFLGERGIPLGPAYPFWERQDLDTFNALENVQLPRSLDSAVACHSTDYAPVTPGPCIPRKISGPQQQHQSDVAYSLHQAQKCSKEPWSFNLPLVNIN
ncbi:hypothetical protein scyTo_0003502, partial [Scyliorhinus torazame]|nr:hypothetical protein [Scyliorhinus torazame]